jgi:hypothetical protein
LQNITLVVTVAELRKWFKENWILFVLSIYFWLVAINLVTFELGAIHLRLVLNQYWFGVVLGATVFDSFGTIFGLFGVAIFYVTLSFFRFIILREFSKFRSILFSIVPIVSAVASSITWNSYFNHTGIIPAGSSGIDFAAMACLIVYCGFDFVLCLDKVAAVKRSKAETIMEGSLLTLILTILISLLIFAVLVQSIFIPGPYNWRTHQFSFFSATILSIVGESGYYWSARKKSKNRNHPSEVHPSNAIAAA